MHGSDAADHIELSGVSTTFTVEADGDSSTLRSVEKITVSAGDGEVVGTNFERKFIAEGRSFNAAVLRKRV